MSEKQIASQRNTSATGQLPMRRGALFRCLHRAEVSPDADPVTEGASRLEAECANTAEQDGRHQAQKLHSR